MTLRTEAQLLKTWMARREGAAQRRRDGPIDALKHRLALLQKETPRLELETANLEKELGRAGKPIGVAALVGGVVRGVLLVAAAALWVAGVVTLTPDARADDPLRLAAMLSIVVLVALGRVTSKAT